MATSFIVTSGDETALDASKDTSTGLPGVGGVQSGTLRQAINFANTTPGEVDISFAPTVSSVTLAKELPVLTGNAVIDGTLTSNTQVTINGGGFRPFIVGDASTHPHENTTFSLTLKNITVSGGTAQGGEGIDGGGGGAGLGGAVLVTSNGALTLNGATLTNNSATGGSSGGLTNFDAGGGGGLGGAGGTPGLGVGYGNGGGGLLTGTNGGLDGGMGGGTGGGHGDLEVGSVATGSNGTFNGGGGGAASDLDSASGGKGGFGGGGGGAAGSISNAGSGGYGGGGGGAESGSGGDGGFGGGGGGRGRGTVGTGGFAAGSASGFQGGGGAGLGGAVFVQAGGTVSILGNTTESMGTAQGGNNGMPYDGNAYGGGFSFQGPVGNGTSASSPYVLNFGDGTQSIGDAIADYVGSGGLNTTSKTNFADQGGSITLAKSGSGTLTLSGTNTYSGGTTISAGTVQVGSGGTTGTLGSGKITDDSSLVFDRSDKDEFSNIVSGSGGLTQAGTGTIALKGKNTYSGNTTISSGTLEIAASAKYTIYETGMSGDNTYLTYQDLYASSVGLAI